jgi:hypothetical protein
MTNADSEKRIAEREREEGRQPAPSFRTAPRLVLACIFALGIAVTAIAVALWPMNIETTFEERKPNQYYEARDSGLLCYGES